MRSVECVDRFPYIPHSSLFYAQIAEKLQNMTSYILP